MRKIQRLAGIGVMAAATLALAACGSTASPRVQPGGASARRRGPVTAAAAAADTGVTTNADVFGPACSQLPQGDAPGSLNAMGPQPVATAASTNPLLTTLVTAVKAVPGLPDTLNSTQGITVFAPYNGAFDAVQKQIGARGLPGPAEGHEQARRPAVLPRRRQALRRQGPGGRGHRRPSSRAAH